MRQFKKGYKGWTTNWNINIIIIIEYHKHNWDIT